MCTVSFPGTVVHYIKHEYNYKAGEMIAFKKICTVSARMREKFMNKLWFEKYYNIEKDMKQNLQQYRKWCDFKTDLRHLLILVYRLKRDWGDISMACICISQFGWQFRRLIAHSAGEVFMWTGCLHHKQQIWMKQISVLVSRTNFQSFLFYFIEIKVV